MSYEPACLGIRNAGKYYGCLLKGYLNEKRITNSLVPGVAPERERFCDPPGIRKHDQWLSGVISD
jgi:hypothetical protein